MNSRIIFIIVCFFTFSLVAQIPSYVPTNGLVGWWPFNGNANDESGNGNHGTVSGATFTLDRNGSVNKSLNLNGSNDFVEVLTTNTNFDNNTFSISFWIQTSSNQTDASIISRLETRNDNISVYQNFVVFQAGVIVALNGGCVWTQGYSSPSIISTSWRHVVYVNTPTSSSLYIDNQLIRTDLSQSPQNMTFYSYPIRFGKSRHSYWRDFNGLLDDVSIYNRKLTDQEISSLYTGTPSCTTPTVTITPQGSTTICQGNSVVLNASTGSNYTYEWYKNGTLINGAISSTYSATTAGNYTVKVIDGSCNATSEGTTITVKELPTHAIDLIASDSIICLGKNITLTPSGGDNYTWNNDSIKNNYDGSFTVKIDSISTFVVTGLDSDGCLSKDSIKIKVYNPPTSISYKIVEDKITNWPAKVFVTGVTGGTPPYKFGGYITNLFPFNYSNVIDKNGVAFFPYNLSVTDSNNCYYKAPDIRIQDSIHSTSTYSKPNFEWVKSFGGLNEDVGYDLSIDNQNNTIVVGSFSDLVDFDPSDQLLELNANDSSTFVIKYDTAGNLLWAKNIGRNVHEYNTLITTDNVGNIYVNLPTYNSYRSGNLTRYYSITYKLNSSGNITWKKTHDLSLDKLKTDAEGNLFISGDFNGTVDFDLGDNVYELTSNYDRDGFLCKMDSLGNFLWVRNIGYNNLNTVEIDYYGNTYVAGEFSTGKTIDFDPSENVYELTTDREQFYLLKINHLGEFKWVKLFDTKYSGFFDVKVAKSGNVYLAGDIYDTLDADPGVDTFLLYAGDICRNTIVIKLNENGDFIWGKTVARGCIGVGRSNIELDAAENIITAGKIEEHVDLDPTLDGTYYVYNYRPIGNKNSYVSSLTKDGDVNWVYNIEGLGNSIFKSIATNNSGEIFLTGYFNENVNFNPGGTQANLVSNGGNDAFVLKLKDKSCINFNAGISLNDSILCLGAKATLIGSTGSNYTYEWYKNGTKINNASSSNLVVEEHGNYKVKISKGNCSSTSSIVAIQFTDTVVWTGSVDTDWHKPCNWNPKMVPEKCTSVMIPLTTNQPIISEIAACKDLSIYSTEGAKLIVNDGANLQIETCPLVPTKNSCP